MEPSTVPELMADSAMPARRSLRPLPRILLMSTAMAQNRKLKLTTMAVTMRRGRDFSSYGVLRGLHYQKGDAAQAKLVRVIKGSVLDVAVDLRRSSPTFGKYVAVELSETNKRQLFIPRGFAHGFLVLSPEAVFCYKVDNVYAPDQEATLMWNDESVSIDWPIKEDLIFSAKDLKGKSLKDAEVFD